MSKYDYKAMEPELNLPAGETPQNMEELYALKQRMAEQAQGAEASLQGLTAEGQAREAQLEDARWRDPQYTGWAPDMTELGEVGGATPGMLYDVPGQEQRYTPYYGPNAGRAFNVGSLAQLPELGAFLNAQKPQETPDFAMLMATPDEREREEDKDDR